MAHPLSGIPWEEVNRPCAICGASESRTKHVFEFSVVPRPFEMRECDGCGLLFNSPRITDLEALYRETYYVFHESERHRYARALHQVKRHLDPSLKTPPNPLDILEVGSAKGHLLHCLRQMGHRVSGVEISSYAAEFARARFALDIFTGSIEEFVSDPASDRRYDIVWCNDILEHVPDPVGFVKSSASLLKPEGRLILDTPNGGAKAVHEEDASWGAYNPYHIFFFSPDNIGALLQHAGLRSSCMFSYDNDPTAGSSTSRTGRSFVRRALQTAGVLVLVNRIRRARSRRLDGALAERAMDSSEIARRLDAMPWFSESEDARKELAADVRGNNLVVHATREPRL